MNKRIKICALITSLIMILTAFVVFASEPGSEGDPLVSKSYIDSAIESIKSYVDEKVSALSYENSDDDSQVSETQGAGFEIVRLASGQRITFSESTEFIIRMGKGCIIASEKGGIADVTAGYDLSGGETTSANHLLIVPVSDGRGFEALEDVIVMVKGSYKIN